MQHYIQNNLHSSSSSFLEGLGIMKQLYNGDNREVILLFVLKTHGPKFTENNHLAPNQNGCCVCLRQYFIV